MATERIIATAAIALVTIATMLHSERRQEHDGKVTVGFFGAILAALVWCPPGVARWVVGAGFVLLAFGIWPGPWSLAVSLAIVVGAWLLVPGGVVVGVAGFLAFVCLLALWAYGETLGRMRRGAALEPGGRPSGDVAVTGAALAGCQHPRTGAPCAGWIATTGDRRKHSQSVLLRTDAGHARVDLEDAEAEWKRRKETYTGEEAAAVARAAGLGDVTDDVELAWVEPGDLVYVIGSPAWEAAPGEGFGYRDTPMMPVFRTTPDARVLVADRGEAQVRAESQASVVQCLALAVCFGGVAALQWASQR